MDDELLDLVDRNDQVIDKIDNGRSAKSLLRETIIILKDYLNSH